jgi:thiol-disulfide isomerase/thioredoxin
MTPYVDVNKPVQLIIIALAVAAALFTTVDSLRLDGDIVDAVSTPATADDMTIEEKAAEYERAKPLTDPTGFINRNVSIADSIGEKVILLDMWTYSCINCQRTLPHLVEWHQAYSDDGLLIIGNHAPEFDFEKKRANVKDAVDTFNITYPVVLDNNYGTWNAYDNRYWPQKYLIGVDGFIRYEHIGEGSYAETEQKIRELLKERNRRLGINRSIDTDGARERDADALDTTDLTTDKIETPELYFGADRNTELANLPAGETGSFTGDEPATVRDDRLYLTGQWTISDTYASAGPGSAIRLSYNAKNVNMVLRGNDTQITVTQDGEPVDMAAGPAVGPDSTVTVTDEQLYKLIENQDYGRHTLRITVDAGTLDAYTFTFG